MYLRFGFPATFLGYGVQIRWRPEDIGGFETPPLGAVVATDPAGVQAVSDEKIEEKIEVLMILLIAGLALGGLTLLSVAVGLMCLWRRRKRGRGETGEGDEGRAEEMERPLETASPAEMQSGNN